MLQSHFPLGTFHCPWIPCVPRSEPFLVLAMGHWNFLPLHTVQQQPIIVTCFYTFSKHIWVSIANLRNADYGTEQLCNLSQLFFVIILLQLKW